MIQLLDKVTMNDQDDRYLSLPELSLYSGLSVSTLKRRLRGPDGFSHFKTGHRVLVKKSEFDLWMEKYRATAPDTPPDKIQDMAKEILKDLGLSEEAA